MSITAQPGRDISQDKEGLPQLVGDLEQGGASRKTQGALEGAGQKIRDLVSDVAGGDDEEERQPSRRSRRGED